MFASPKLITGKVSPSRKVRLLLNHGAGFPIKLTTRRTSGWLSCRLPFLTLWSIVVIFLLYKLLNTSNDITNDIQPTFSSNSEKIPSNEAKSSSFQLLIDRSESHGKQLRDIVGDDVNVNSRRGSFNLPSIATSDIGTAQEVRPETRKSNNGTWYMKQSKVFILIIQKEHFPLPISSSRHNNLRSQTSTIKYNSDDSLNWEARISPHQLIIPAHIKIVIEILEAHRIKYTIDTTRSGLPAQLLADQDTNSDNRKYSVIILDDFIKYTKLNRWIRDQLDRHCRINQIGVVTFLNHDNYSNNDNNQEPNHTNIRRSISNMLLHPNKPFVTDDIHEKTSSSTTHKESLTDQFPLIVRPFDQVNCLNSTNHPCLVDYQLNEKSPVLRIIKRKANFILPGLMRENLNQSPWMSMSSNHVTYEPLTWAKLCKSKTSSSTLFSPTDVNKSKYKNTKVGTQEKNYLAKTSNIGSHPNPNNKNVHIKSYNEHNIKSGPKKDYTESYTKHNRTLVNSKHITDADTNSTNLHETTPFGLEQSAFSNEDVIEVADADETSKYEMDFSERIVLSMFDRGHFDGIKRVLFGGASHHWLNRVLLLDSIEHLSGGRILDSLERYIQIDIDDIFVGESGKRMKSSDVDSLIETQKNLSKKIEGGFKFNLGFSGKYFKHGVKEENLGDEHLIANACEFTWFCHTWSHSKAHLFNDTQDIVNELKKNVEFAKKHQLPIIGHKGIEDFDLETLPPTYAIAPHHSGVYPVHSQLYEAWRKVLNVQVTSTEEYPHLKPASGRRAFVHQQIKVLPRQTCGLYTHTIYRDKYPNGIDKLDALIKGGELFETILHNPVNIYMSHMTNYANDRLAQYTFNTLVDFVIEHTNLQLKYAPSSSWTNNVNHQNHSPTSSTTTRHESVLSSSDLISSEQAQKINSQHDDDDDNQLGPNKLADYYFGLLPEEKQPLWSNPCNDKRHMAIWQKSKKAYCFIAPKILIVGPQKTGTTALYTFLKMNPIFKSSQPSPVDYEEVQFFNNKHYNKGVDWYFNRFITGNNSKWSEKIQQNYSIEDENENSYVNDLEEIYYDKSATYFDDPQAALRASNLLPEAFIVILLVNPADRAYSWYQHMKAHGDFIANSIDFDQLIMSSDDSNNNNNYLDDEKSKGLRSLRSRCLHPGYYFQHLTKWLEYYDSRKIIIIDGLWFKHKPALVMNKLQLLLRVEQPLDYDKLLVYSEEKGFYCQRLADETKQHTTTTSKTKEQIKCLGQSKGRKYEPMSKEARLFLNRHYWTHNRQLARLLTDIGQPLPIWMEDAMTFANVRASVIY